MKTFTLLLAALPAAFAHTIFTQLNGNPIGYGIRDPSYDGPIQDVTSDYLACNGGSNPTTASPYVITVQAGSTAQLTWRHTLTSGSNDVIDPSHLGPVMAYMKKSSNATTDVGYGSGWFKIQESGYSNGVWATTTLVRSPSCPSSAQSISISIPTTASTLTIATATNSPSDQPARRPDCHHSLLHRPRSVSAPW